MLQHLTQKLHHFLRRDPLVVQAEDELTGSCDGRHRRNPSAFAGNCLLRRFPARRPCLCQKRGQRDVGFVLKVQYCLVFPHRTPNLGQFLASPVLPFFLRHFKILFLRLLIGQTRFVQPTHHRLFRDRDPKFRLYDLNQSPGRPKIGFKTIFGGRRQDYSLQASGTQLRQFTGTARHCSTAQTAIAFVIEACQPSMHGRPVCTIGMGNLGNRQAIIDNGFDGPYANLQSRIPKNRQRSFAHS